MNNLQKTFDKIRAEEELKKKTLHFVRNTRQKKGESHKKMSFSSHHVVMICLMMIMFLGGTYSYFKPVSYISMDVNPSIELTINSFNRVIGVQAFNEEGKVVLFELSLQHKEYDEAALLIMEKITDLGYWKEDSSVFITVQSDNLNRESTILETIEMGVDSHMETHHTGGQVDIFSVDSETRKCAHREGMSTAKYLAILQLQELDLTTTMEEHCKRSIKEIKQMIEEHHNDRNENADDFNNVPDKDTDSNNTNHGSGSHGGHNHNGNKERN